MRIKDVVIKSKNDNSISKYYAGLENVSGWSGVVDYKYINDDTDYPDTFQYVKKNSICFSKLRPYLAKGFIADKNIIASTEFFNFEVKNNVNKKFFLYYILNKNFIERINNSVYGIGMPRLNWNLFCNFETIEFCSLDTQNKIVAYLDENCSKIDTEIELLEKKSILLDEYKNALIYETVTKGLDKNAEMKDSGIDWIGKIPKIWKVTRLKNIYIYKNGYAFSDDDYCDESNSYLVKITNIGRENCFDEMQNLKINNLNSSFKIKNNSVLYALSGSVGKCSFYEKKNNNDCYLNQRVAELTMKKNNVKYLYYAISNNAFKTSIFDLIQGNVIKNLNKGHLDNSFITIPSIEQQNEIVCFLDSETIKIETQIELINKKVELLKEYKQSLIYEAVTGQLEIE